MQISGGVTIGSGISAIANYLAAPPLVTLTGNEQSNGTVYPGSRSDSFWMTDVIIATDYPGYGQPLTLDSGGRPYISNQVSVNFL